MGATAKKYDLVRGGIHHKLSLEVRHLIRQKDAYNLCNCTYITYMQRLLFLPFDYKFSIGHQFSDIVVLNVDVLGTGLALSILCQDDARFVVTVKDATARILCEFTEATKRIMSVTETSSKIHEPLTYEEAISDPVHTCK